MGLDEMFFFLLLLLVSSGASGAGICSGAKRLGDAFVDAYFGAGVSLDAAWLFGEACCLGRATALNSWDVSARAASDTDSAVFALRLQQSSVAHAAAKAEATTRTTSTTT